MRKKKGQSYKHDIECVFAPNDIEGVLAESVSGNNLFGKSNGIYYYNVPCAFDIETSSFYRDEDGAAYTYRDLCEMRRNNPGLKLEKASIMYVWQFGINGRVIVGRTWKEFTDMLAAIANALQLSEKRILIVYVHNLSFEFQFIRRLFKWDKVFSVSERTPIYARTVNFIEFRCSYLLSGYSLEKLGEQLRKYKVSKMSGDLDYSLLRHSGTPLTDKEIGYCINDVRVVMAYIQEKIENEGGITRIPLTKTGYVRNFCRKNCLRYKDDNNKQRYSYKYKDIIDDCYIDGVDEFSNLRRAFQGGFTHANAYRVGVILNDVASYDFTSSYPYVMVSEKYPMTHGVKVQPKSEVEFMKYLDRYLSIINVAFTDLMLYETVEAPLSVSKCSHAQNLVEDNGRVVCADYVETTLTNIDFVILKKFYKWSKLEVGVMWCYGKDYLPTEFVKSILTLYQQKTTLKGVGGKETEYMLSKEMLNSCYGMCVTNPIRDEFVYEGDEWELRQKSMQEMENALIQYNMERNRFLSYCWGVFVTAYARRNLFSGILECGNDYVYSDTDSIKVLNYERHIAYIKRYNDMVRVKLLEACKHHGISFELCEPTTVKGVKKLLGVWDFEGVYTHFKTLGAKRYMTKKDGEFSLTVSGVNKKFAVPYMVGKWGDKCMEHFTDYLYLPPKATGKNTLTYIDYDIGGCITDYMGNVGSYDAPTGLHLEPTDYHLNLSVLYLDYLRGLRLRG